VNLEKSGYRPQTISSHSRILRLLDKNCKLEDPETIFFSVMSATNTGPSLMQS